MLQTLFAVALFFAAAAASSLSTPRNCVDEQSLRGAVQSELPNLNITTITGPEAGAFIAGFNALPPQTNAKAESVLLLTMPEAPQAVIVFFSGGCLIGKAAMPRPLLETLLRQLAEEV
jgi:hypothetical protein